MTAFAGTSQSTFHDADALTDDALRDLFAYPDGLSQPRLRANFIASIDGAVTLDGSGRRLGTQTDRRGVIRVGGVAGGGFVRCNPAAGQPYGAIFVGGGPPT